MQVTVFCFSDVCLGLRYPELISDTGLQIIHVPLYLVVCDLGVNLRGRDMLVPQHLRYRLDRNTLRQADRGSEGVPSDMRGRYERQSGTPGYRLQRYSERIISRNGKDRPVRKSPPTRVRRATTAPGTAYPSSAVRR